jgi:hypothetical protein
MAEVFEFYVHVEAFLLSSNHEERYKLFVTICSKYIEYHFDSQSIRGDFILFLCLLGSFLLIVSMH